MALGVALVMLVVVMLLGLGVLRMVTNQERMTGYAQDRALALQAADAALREVENLIQLIQPQPMSGTCATAANPAAAPGAAAAATVMVCPPLAAASTPRWLDSTFNSWANASAVGPASAALTPQYFTEFLGNQFPCGTGSGAPRNCLRYRITARAGASGRAQVTLQSLYAP